MDHLFRGASVFRSKRILIPCLIALCVALLLVSFLIFRPTLSKLFEVTPEDLKVDAPEEETFSYTRFLTVDKEMREYFTADSVKAMREHFEAVYPILCEFYNLGRMPDVRYRLSNDPDGERVISAKEGSEYILYLNASHFTKYQRDFSVLTEALALSIAGYLDAYLYEEGAWVFAAMAAYGRYLTEGDALILPSYEAGQSYRESSLVALRFFLWIDDEIEHSFLEQMNEALRSERYTAGLFSTVTGYRVDELWQLYVAEQSGVAK